MASRTAPGVGSGGAGSQIGRQRRGDDVAGLDVAVGGHVRGPARRVQRRRRRTSPRRPDPRRGAVRSCARPSRRRRRRSTSPSLSVTRSGGSAWASPSMRSISRSSSDAQLGDAAARLGLVLQGAAEPEQRDRRRVRVDLDGPPRRPRIRIDVEVQGRRRAGRRAGRPANSGLPVLVGCAPASNFAKSRLSAVSRGPLAGRVGHDQRRVDGDQAVACDVGRERGPDAGVVLGGADVAPDARRRRRRRRRWACVDPRRGPGRRSTRALLCLISRRSRPVSCVFVSIPECPGHPLRQRRDGGDLVAGGQDRRRAAAVAGGAARPGRTGGRGARRRASPTTSGCSRTSTWRRSPRANG